VRENAAVLAETFVADAGVERQLVRMATDGDARVRFQVAVALGAWDDERALPALAAIAAGGAGDRWTRLAVAAAVPRRAGALAARVRGAPLLRELASVVGARQDPAEVDGLLAHAAARPSVEALALVAGLADGLGRRGVKLGDVLGRVRDARARSAAERVLARAAARAADRALPVVDRREAVALLAHAPWSSARDPLARLLADDRAPEVAVGAAQALAAHVAPEVPELLLRGFAGRAPAVRREILEAFARRPERLPRLLDEVAGGRIAPGELGAPLRRRLLDDARPEVRSRAQALLHAAADRDVVIARYRTALAHPGDPGRGRAVFQRICAACHRVGELGASVGPDISDTMARTPEALLTDILDPSRAIDANYVVYTVETRGGAVVSGFLAAQTAGSVTLRRGDGQEDVVLRQDVARMSSSGTSLMPDGLENAISIPEMGDLIAFLRNWRG
jgi:putative heme-binding domain-containing protein